MEKKLVVGAVEQALGEEGQPADASRRSGAGEGQAAEREVSWTEADEVWCAKAVPAELQHLTRRYGRALFSLVMRVGACNYALGLIAKRNAGNREQMTAAHVLGRAFEDILRAYVAAKGWGMDRFKECQRDVELVGELQGRQAGERRSSGGILLND